jgi:hypothetical protein
MDSHQAIPANAPYENFKFALMWSNDATLHNQSMSQRTCTLRDVGGRGGPLTCRELHLDHVQIVFRPTTDIGALEFQSGDSALYTWRVETSQLMIRTKPGQQHTLFTLGLNRANDKGPVSNREPNRSVVYSQALSLAPDVQGTEDYWARTYRPMRDLPIAVNLQNVSELDIQLIFPLLFDDALAPTASVPDYRILKVYLEFSVNP